MSAHAMNLAECRLHLDHYKLALVMGWGVPRFLSEDVSRWEDNCRLIAAKLIGGDL